MKNLLDCACLAPDRAFFVQIDGAAGLAMQWADHKKSAKKVNIHLGIDN